jgi:hypothetical protein
MREAVQRLTTIRFKCETATAASAGRSSTCRATRASRLSHRPLQRQPQRLARRRPRRAEGTMRVLMIDFAMALVIVGAFSGAFWLFLHP